jgi:hypothetical protein
MTKKELIGKLRALAKNNQDLSGDTELLAECRKLGLKDFDTTKPGKIADILENSPDMEPVVEEVKTKALNSQDLKVILDEYEKHKQLDDAKRIAVEIQNNPLLKKADSKEILRIIERKLKIEADKLKEGKTPEVAKKISNEIVETEEILMEVKPATVKREEVELLAERIVEVAETSETLEDSRKRIAAMTKDVVIDKEFRAEITEAVALETANKIVETKMEEVVRSLTDELTDFKPTAEQIEKIKTIVKERIDTRLEDPTKKIDEHKAIVVEESGKKTVNMGTNLTEEIAEVLGEKAIDKKTQIEVAVKRAETSLDEKLFINKTNQNSPVDVIRGAKLEEEIISRMVETGASREAAKSTAVMIRELSFPREQSSASTAVVLATKQLEQNGFHGGDNPRFAEQASAIRNLIRSPVKIGENVNKILGVANKLGGIKGFEPLNAVAKSLKDNPHLVKSLELIQNVIKFQGTIGNITGWVTNPIGTLFRIPAIQEFAVQVATRLGGETVGAIATQIASFGLEGGIKNVIGQIFATGTATAVKAGATAAAQGAATVAGTAAVDATVDAGLAATGVGLPVAAVLAVVQLGLAVLGKILKPVKEKLEKVFESLGVGSAKTKLFLQDQFGKLFGGLLYWGGMAATFLLGPALLTGLAGATIIAGGTSIVTLGGLAFMQQSTAQSVSSLVAPKGMGQSCVKVSSPESGNCNCNTNVAEAMVNGIGGKNNYEAKVNQWWTKGGKNCAVKCFNHTVCASKNAGIDPRIALTTWLSESVASNYDTTAGMDFGINISGVSRKNFLEQIQTYLKQPRAMLNECRSRYPNNTETEVFFATFVRMISGDCPDPNSGVGKEYVDLQKQIYGFITNGAPLPSSPFITAENNNCGSNSGTDTNSSDSSYTYTDKNGDTWLCAADNTTNIVGSLVPATPIYDDSCLESPAYCVVTYLLGNGVVTITRSNAAAVVNLINQWKNAPVNFNKANFGSVVISNTNNWDAFQCVGFAVGINPKIGNNDWGNDRSSWEAMIAHGSQDCPRIDSANAGVGDFILYPSVAVQWYHIVVLSRLRTDGTYSISQANSGLPGQISNKEGPDIKSYLVGKSVLRCQ